MWQVKRNGDEPNPRLVVDNVQMLGVEVQDQSDVEMLLDPTLNEVPERSITPEETGVLSVDAAGRTGLMADEDVEMLPAPTDIMRNRRVTRSMTVRVRAVEATRRELEQASAKRGPKGKKSNSKKGKVRK